jgi:amino acid transporter
MFCIVLAATLLAAIYGFGTSQVTFLRELSRILGNAPAAPANQTPSLSAFISVIGLFIFLYGGLTGATSLGGEARDASRTMPRGIILSWFSALVLYAIVAMALFHAVPWWTVQPLIKSHHSELATMPGLIGLVAPSAVDALINVLVFIIVVKTIAPQLQDSSRYLFAWAQDGLLPRAFLHTARSKAPDLALVVSALLGFLFLLEASLIGWSVGVSIRSATIVLVFGFLGAGAVNVWFNRQFAGAACGRVRTAPTVGRRCRRGHRRWARSGSGALRAPGTMGAA